MDRDESLRIISNTNNPNKGADIINRLAHYLIVARYKNTP